MAKIICNKCGATGTSKCPYCRSIFPDSHGEATLSWIFKRRIKVEKKLHWLEVFLFMGDGTEKNNLAWGMHELRNILNNMEDPEVKHYPSIDAYACDHVWEFADGEKSSIGCGHGSKKKRSKKEEK